MPEASLFEYCYVNMLAVGSGSVMVLHRVMKTFLIFLWSVSAVSDTKLLA